MLRSALVGFITLTVLTAGPPALGASAPNTSAAVLSFIDDDSVELRYFNDRNYPNGRNDILPAMDFTQTLAALSIVAATPAGPWNPALVDAALHVLGIPHQDYTSCWPDAGALVGVPTAPASAIEAALNAAGSYYDPDRHPREFATAYWSKLFQYQNDAPRIPGLPGDIAKEALKEAIVTALPFPSKIGPMSTYQARGVVPLLYVKGEWVPVCFLFICWYVPKCVVNFVPVSEGYGLTGIK